LEVANMKKAINAGGCNYGDSGMPLIWMDGCPGGLFNVSEGFYE
jgi:hypothetical protein